MAYDFNSLTKQADEASNRDKFYTDFEDVDPNTLHQISELTEWMRTKGKGSDVREVIAQLFERTWLEGTKEGNANLEVAKARGGFETLSSRLNNFDAAIQNVASGSPKGVFPNLSELQSAKPNGDSGIYITTDNGHWYYYNDGWRDGGTYQAIELADGSVTPQKIASDYDAIRELIFESGTLNSLNGVKVPDDRRIRSSNFIKVKAGYTIKVLNNAFSFGVFTYQSPNTATFIGAEAVWYKSFTIKQDCYIRLTVAFDSNSTDIANYKTSVPSIIAIPDSGTLVYKSTDIKNGIINESHLSAELQNKVNGTGSPKIVDLVMMMGQSNMAGRGITNSTYPQTAPTVPVGKGYEFRAISDPTKLYQIVEPFGVNENNATSGVTETTKTGSMVSAFANEYYDKTGVPIVAVSCSKGGTSISWWQPTGLPLQDAITRFKKAESWLLSNGYTIRHRYMVWCQGETDGDNSMTGETYKTNFLTMVKAMFAEGIEKCFVVRIGNHRDNATVYNPIIQAQTELAKETENVVLVSTKFDKMATDGLMKDTFHYYQHGYNIVGADAGRNAAFYVKTGKEPTMYDWENQCLYFSHK